jgi:hypothetical protein
VRVAMSTLCAGPAAAVMIPFSFSFMQGETAGGD